MENWAVAQAKRHQPPDAPFQISGIPAEFLSLPLQHLQHSVLLYLLTRGQVLAE